MQLQSIGCWFSMYGKGDTIREVKRLVFVNRQVQ